MDNNQTCGLGNGKEEIFENVAKEAVAGISSSIHRKYEIIDLEKVPDHANYSKVEKYLRSINIEITRKMFFSYLKENLLPGGHEVKNTNFSYYTREQIIFYILVDMFKPVLPLHKVKILFEGIIKPMIGDIGLESSYLALCEMINGITDSFEEVVTAAIRDEGLRIKKASVKLPEDTNDEIKKAQYHIAHYTHLVTLCMAKSALDFYKFAPNTLLE